LYKLHEVLYLQAIVLAWISIGFKKAVKMFFDYPGVYLTPIFTPFIFGPVEPKEPKEPSRWCNYFGNMNMHVSFWFTYVNTFLCGIGLSLALCHILSLKEDFFAQYGHEAVVTEFFDQFGFANPSSFLSVLHWTFLVVFLLLVIFIVATFHILETREYCCNFCRPFTVRNEYHPLKDEAEQNQDLELIETVA
jgi:hypothetical protein